MIGYVKLGVCPVCGRDLSATHLYTSFDNNQIKDVTELISLMSSQNICFDIYTVEGLLNLRLRNIPHVQGEKMLIKSSSVLFINEDCKSVRTVYASKEVWSQNFLKIINELF